MDAALLIRSGVEAICKETRESVRSKRGLGAVLAMSMDSMIVLGAVRAEGADLPVGRFDPTTARVRIRLAGRKIFSNRGQAGGPSEIDFSDVSPLNHWLPFVKRLPAPLHCIGLAGGWRGALRVSVHAFLPAPDCCLPFSLRCGDADGERPQAPSGSALRIPADCGNRERHGVTGGRVAIRARQRLPGEHGPSTKNLTI